MESKFVVSFFLLLLSQQQICEAGKGFGGGFAGGFGGFVGGPGNIGLINQQRQKIIQAQILVNLSVSSANTTIQNSISAAQTAIDNAIAAAQSSANAVKSKACVDQHASALAKVSSDSVKACDQADQFTAVQAQTVLLTSFHSRISVIYALCPIFAPPDCATNLLEGIDTEITDLQTSILENVTKIKDDAAKCVQDATEKANGAIATANAALDECAKSYA